ncbi:MAG: sodium:calcium antiporter [Collinsella sp.]
MSPETCSCPSRSCAVRHCAAWFGADYVVNNSVTIATALGISERVIGITVIALGTCLPELVTSVVAAFKGNTDIAVGNVVGSNITNVLLVMGVPALFSPVAYATGYNLDFALLAIFSSCSWALPLWAPSTP